MRVGRKLTGQDLFKPKNLLLEKYAENHQATYLLRFLSSLNVFHTSR